MPVIDDELLALFGLDEELWQPILPWNPRRPSTPITDEEVLPPRGLDEEGWTAWRATSGIWIVAQPLVDDPTLPVAFDDEAWPLNRPWPWMGGRLPILDDGSATTSGIKIRLIDVFMILCAKTKAASILCAQTKPMPVRVQKTISQTVSL